ncbi:hypothetical protein BJY01DRAFT_248991 [Aspergillus pseudoustus]|uniref:Uncharacterized protein n=1 Tax=Aspergillus pseudoustus TaxID=1810923 RepID=A0ABR4JSC1_9EURO
MDGGEQLQESAKCTVHIPSSNLTAWFVLSGDRIPRMKGFIVQAVMQSSQAAVYKNFTTTAIKYIAPRLSGNWWADGDPSSDTIGSAFHPPWGPELGMLLPNHTFTYGLATNVALSRFLSINFGGYFWRTENLQQGFNPETQALGLGDIVGCTDELAARLNCTMHNIAQAVSKSFRDSRYSLDPGDNGTEVAVDLVRVNATYVSVQWLWLALPVFVWAVDVVLLVGALWKIRRGKVPSWRNDPVPLLFLYSEERLETGQGSGVAFHRNDDFDDLNVRLYERTGRLTPDRK